MDIKPIETIYNGYRFRSRLEAKWAVFFEAGGIRYEYEPEGFVSDGEAPYLPDFYLPDFDMYAEAKRNTPDGVAELTKCIHAIQWGGPIKKILILSDVPEGRSVDGGIWHFPILYWCDDGVIWGWWFFHDGWLKTGEEFVDGNVSKANYPRPDYYLLDRKTNLMSIKAVSDVDLHNYNNRHPRESMFGFGKKSDIELQENINKRTFNAFKTARAARFEHGEKPLKEDTHEAIQ